MRTIATPSTDAVASHKTQLTHALSHHSPLGRKKLFWYSVIDAGVMIAVAVGQVYVVRYLFEKGSTKRYRV